MKNWLRRDFIKATLAGGATVAGAAALAAVVEKPAAVHSQGPTPEPTHKSHSARMTR